MGATKDLSAFIAETSSKSIPFETIQAAKPLFLDALGICLAASVYPVGKIGIKYTQEVSGKAQASVIGSGLKTSVTEAAFANGFLLRSLEFDDCWLPMGHPSSAIVPASLALAESLSLSGRQMLEAYVMGVEAGARISIACGDVVAKGWSLGIYATMGATAAASRCLRLDAKETSMALGIAASAAAGLAQPSMLFAFVKGSAARHGVLSAMLARGGLISPEDILERPGGFASAFRGEGARGFEGMAESLGKTYVITHPGIGIRKYPVVYFFQGVVDATLEVLLEKQIYLEDIDELRVIVTPRQVEFYGTRKPENGFQSKFNLPYILGTAIYERKVGLESFVDEAMHDPRRLEAIGKVKMETLQPKDIPAGVPEQYFNPPVHIKLKDGRTFHHRIDPPRGDWKDPTPKWNVAVPKFQHISRLKLSEKNSQRVINLVEDLDRMHNLDELMSLVRT
jgi:2-methylcitrate dehydratase PrpD